MESVFHRKCEVLEVTKSWIGRVVCPFCQVTFKLSDRRVWTGYRHKTCGQKLRITNDSKQPEPIWCLVANIVTVRMVGPGGMEHRPGTKHFPAGSKIYCYPPQWGDEFEKIKVIGHHRGSHHWVSVVIKTAWLTNGRAKMVYEPFVLDELSGPWDGTNNSKKLAESLAEAINRGTDKQINQA